MLVASLIVYWLIFQNGKQHCANCFNEIRKAALKGDSVTFSMHFIIQEMLSGELTWTSHCTVLFIIPIHHHKDPVKEEKKKATGAGNDHIDQGLDPEREAHEVIPKVLDQEALIGLKNQNYVSSRKKNPSTMTDYRKSRSPYRKSDFRPRKHSRRGRSRSKSKSPSSTKDRSRSPDDYEKLRVKYKSKYKSRNNSRSKSLSKSPKRYRNKSRSPEIFKRSRRRSKTRSPPRKRSKSKSWSPERQGNRSKSPQRSKSKSPYRSNKVNGST